MFAFNAFGTGCLWLFILQEFLTLQHPLNAACLVFNSFNQFNGFAGPKRTHFNTWLCKEKLSLAVWVLHKPNEPLPAPPACRHSPPWTHHQPSSCPATLPSTAPSAQERSWPNPACSDPGVITSKLFAASRRLVHVGSGIRGQRGPIAVATGVTSEKKTAWGALPSY